ncbi:MAG: NAD-dependent epimerase/dehydratase family protein [Desulfobacterales bacterium]|nr:NAD-dependent epimerase/dehydratase family protein [Desulfobacterales bacterium]
MKILITGGAGFIGSHTADALIAQGHRVRILDNLQPTVHPKGKPSYLNPKAEFMVGDVRDRAAWQQGLRGVDAVFHLAAYQDYLTDFSTFFHVNTVSTALLYEILAASGQPMQRVIVAASQAVMGEGRYQCPQCAETDKAYIYPEIRIEAQMAAGLWDHRCPDCDSPLQWLPSDETVIHPCNQYAISKHSQEQIAIQLGRRYDIPSAVMRYSIVQGPRQSFYNAYSGAMRIFALSLFFDRPPVIFEDGCQIRDFVNIEDVVRANLLVLDHPRAAGGVFNVGGGRPWTVLDFFRAMERITGREKEPVLSGDYRYGDTRHIFSDITRLQNLGWQPRRGVEESIAAYWDYLQQQQDLDDILAFAEKHMKRLGVIRSSRKNP